MKRIDYFLDKVQNLPYSSIYKRLRPLEVSELKDFIINNEALDVNLYEMKVNRWFMDIKNKPKNWTSMTELASVANGCKK